MSAVDPSEFAPVRLIRTGAFVIDVLLVGLVAVVALFVLVGGAAAIGVATGSDGGAVAIALAIGTWAVLVLVVGGYFTALVGALGHTLGMRLLDLIVVDEAGDPATWRQAAIRTAVLLAPLPLLAVPILAFPALGVPISLVVLVGWLTVEGVVMFVDENEQRLGDRLANTRVVEEPRG